MLRAHATSTRTSTSTGTGTSTSTRFNCAASTAPLQLAARRVFLLGATGTISRVSVRALLQRGHEVVCLPRPRAGPCGCLAVADSQRLLAAAEVRSGDVQDPALLARDGFRGDRFDVLVSCLVSRTGTHRHVQGRPRHRPTGASARKRHAFSAFGHGRLTACKPISDDDLAASITRCLDGSSMHKRVLPIGHRRPR